MTSTSGITGSLREKSQTIAPFGAPLVIAVTAGERDLPEEEDMNTPELTVLAMVALFSFGFVMTVVGGVGFMRSHPMLMESRHRLSHGVIFAAAGLMFVGGIGVHFTGSSNTAFLKGQMQRASQCELASEAAHPEARGKSSGVISRQIVACMQTAGFDWSDENGRCQDAPVATNGYCYQPVAWFDRAVTTAQLIFD
jgi:hypothetical protein